ncbi:hypothetical protein LNKW23_18110 [Paralimibaculum aggregatum]|uniref:Uncharacterized protein n=1 Tax=Paralimibaculum aggregatum TaxID=3036245 RepID=A0ABQ6LP64_9RHOB|nr:hypothetical protein [Limibaculum sp. NKW23]GMG82598.1 hypothetical protein LNKW23_18110 [Limibaculum sp. NKW23]
MSGARRIARGYVDRDGAEPALDLTAGRTRLAESRMACDMVTALAERRLPVMPGRDAGPVSLARGPVALDVVEVEGRRQTVARRTGRGLRALTPPQRDVAAAYAGLAERVASVSRDQEGGGGRGGSSDGGAATRVEWAELLRACHRAIGAEAVAVSARGQADRAARGAVPVLELVDRVCVDGWALCDVLAAHGLPRTRTAKAALSAALGAAMDRLGALL